MNDVHFLNGDTCILSSGRDNAIRMWDMRKLVTSNSMPVSAIVREYKSHKCASFNVGTVLMGPDDTYIATGSEDKMIYIYNVATGEVVNTLKGHKSVVHLVHANKHAADPYTIASGSIQGSATILYGVNSENKDQQQKVTIPSGQGEEEMTEMQREVTEKVMEKYGDQIIQLFHKHNFPFSRGLDSLMINIPVSADASNMPPEMQQLIAQQMQQQQGGQNEQEETDDVAEEIEMSEEEENAMMESIMQGNVSEEQMNSLMTDFGKALEIALRQAQFLRQQQQSQTTTTTTTPMPNNTTRPESPLRTTEEEDEEEEFGLEEVD